MPALLLAGPPARPVVFGYSAVWRDAVTSPADYDYEHLTHIARAFIRPTADGGVTVPDGYFNPALESAARAHGVKLLLSLGGGGGNATDWVSMATTPAHLAKFLDHLNRMMIEHHYDGIDVDWEPPDPTKIDGDAYGLFIKALRQRFPKAVITTALPADTYQTRFTPWPDVIATMDYINVMAYDFSGPWSGIAGHASNLFPAGDYKGAAGKSVDEGMKNLIDRQHVPPAKLVLGMNFYGYRFRVDHLGDAFKANAPGVSDDLTYPQIQALIRSGRYQVKTDTAAAMPYLTRVGGGGVVAFEDPASVERKCEYAKKLGCAGVMIWNIAADVSSQESPLMDAVVKTYGGSKTTLSRAVLEAQIVEAANQAQTADPRPTLDGLSIQQLDELNAKLQVQAAIANDAKWQASAPKH